MKDIEAIFRRNRVACDGRILCPTEDWDAIVGHVCDIEAINEEMYAILEGIDLDDPETKETLGVNFVNNLTSMLAKARGES